MALTPEQLAALQAYYNPKQSNGVNTPYQQGGMVYQTNAQQGNLETGDGAMQATEIYGYDPSHQDYKSGDQYNVYGLTGGDMGKRSFENPTPASDWIIPLMAGLGMAAIPVAAGAGAGANAGVAGVGDAGWGMDLGQEGLAGTGSMGGGGGAAGAANGSWDVLPDAVGGGGTSMGGAGAGAGGGAGGIGGGAGAGGGLSSLLPSGMSGLLGPAATVIGGLLGSKGQTASQTTTHEIPEWLKPYLTGEGGLFNVTRDQLGRTYSPEQIAQRDAIRTRGMGLMNTPIAGNPTAGWTFPQR